MATLASAFLLVLPIFGLIFAGWVAARAGVFGPQAATEINRFVVWLALPALMFDVISRSHWTDLWQPGFIAVLTLSSVLSMGLALIIGLRVHGNLADAAIQGLNAGYPNIGFVGFPLALAAFGPQSVLLTTIGTIITMCVVFASAIVLLEVSTHRGSRPLAVAAKVTASVVRNPIILASLLAMPFALFSLPVPEAATTFLHLLASAASPCALVALGLFLVSNEQKGSPDAGMTGLLVTVKLVLHPLMTWILGRYVFALPDTAVNIAVLFAALPTGTGAFLLAKLYDRQAAISSKTIIVSTLISTVTLSAYLAFIR